MKQIDTLLLITTSYPRWGNGREAAGAYVADLAEVLAKSVNVRVVAPGDEQRVEVESSSLTIYRYAAPQRRLVSLRIWNPLEAWKIFGTLRSGMRSVDSATSDGRVFHSLALWALPSGYWAYRVFRGRKVPYSVWMLGSDVWLLAKIPVVRSMLRLVMRNATRRYADGVQLAGDSMAICQKDVDFLPSTREMGVSNCDPPADMPPYRLVFIGRWHKHKGIDLFLDALAMLRDEDWSRISEVRVFGGGPLAKMVRQRVDALARASRPVALGGFIPKAEAEREIAMADYLVIPSRIESIPVVFSDAVKLGRPVIATPVGDLPALFEHAACGVMAANVSASAICDAIREALASQPSRFAHAVRVQAEKFDLSVIASRILDATKPKEAFHGARCADQLDSEVTMERQ